MNTTSSLEKQKKGSNLYVYNFAPITTGAGSRTPEHHSTPPTTSVTKKIIHSSMWGFRKPKPKPKPNPVPTPSVEKDKEMIVECKKHNKTGTETETGTRKDGRKSLSSVEGILMGLANTDYKKEKNNKTGTETGDRKSVSSVEGILMGLAKGSHVTEGRKSVSAIEGKGREGNGRKSVSHVEGHVGLNAVEKPRKSTGAKLEMAANVASAIAVLQVKVLVTDMPGFMQVHAFQCARNTYDSLEKFSAKHLAFNLKKEFDKVYGPAWHCIVGSSFGSFVTHATGCFLYFSMEKLCILLFRTKVERALAKVT